MTRIYLTGILAFMLLAAQPIAVRGQEPPGPGEEAEPLYLVCDAIETNIVANRPQAAVLYVSLAIDLPRSRMRVNDGPTGGATITPDFILFQINRNQVRLNRDNGRLTGSGYLNNGLASPFRIDGSCRRRSAGHPNPPF